MKMPKDYSGIHTLRSLIRLIIASLNGKIDNDAIINNLTTADSNAPLSAAQGRILLQMIQAVDADGDGVADNANHLGGHPTEYFAVAGEANRYLDEILGQPGGVPPLGPDALIPSQYLPSYVDDVIEGYYDAETDKFYKDQEHLREITPETDKIYLDLVTNYSYRYGGSTFVLITSSDLVEIMPEDVEDLWNAIAFRLNTAAKKQFFIHYDGNGGTGYMVDGIATEDTVFVPAENRFSPPAGRHFSGWEIQDAITSDNTMHIDVTNGYVFEKETTVYAVWVEDNGSLPTEPDVPADAITSLPVINGTVEISNPNPGIGESVIVTVQGNPNGTGSGAYTLKDITFTDTDGKQLPFINMDSMAADQETVTGKHQFSFLYGGKNVTISAVFSKEAVVGIADVGPGGTIALNPTNPNIGDRVNINVTILDGYDKSVLTAKTINDQSVEIKLDGVGVPYFTYYGMPVTVTARFQTVITVTAMDKEIDYAAEVPNLGEPKFGLDFGTTFSNGTALTSITDIIDTLPALAYETTPDPNVGGSTYTIVPSGAISENPRYIFAYKSGTLRVKTWEECHPDADGIDLYAVYDNTQGAVTVNPAAVKPTRQAIITPVPASGYEVDSIRLVNKTDPAKAVSSVLTDNLDGTWAFVMADSAPLNIEVTFRPTSGPTTGS